MSFIALGLGCHSGPRVDDLSGGNSTAGFTEGGDGAEASGDAADGTTKLDVQGSNPGGGACEVPPGGIDAPPDCDEEAPPDSFDPVVQWSWDEGLFVAVSPLVANLDDDDGNGTIDLCDIPEVVVVAYELYSEAPTMRDGRVHVLDGATGAIDAVFEMPVDALTEPALGDIDGDGLVEILTQRYTPGNGLDAPVFELIAFEHDGEVAWVGPEWGWAWWGVNPGKSAYEAIALADLDNDGDVEILAGNLVVDHEGNELWRSPQEDIAMAGSASVASDLDGDDDLEVIIGPTAYHHDGSHYYANDAVQPGFPQVADLDDDGEPEVLLTTEQGISMLEHDGTTKFIDLRPTGDAPEGLNWLRPATVHDFDGDGVAEFATASRHHYAVYEGDATLAWVESVSDASGGAAGTAFDFLGDGVAEAMYADEVALHVFDVEGNSYLEVPRTSVTGIEIPVVADVDNDGSAEIVIVSNQGFFGSPSAAVRVIRDAQDRWIPSRRIWNQHAYHVTNVREDGTIPKHEPRHWESLNTFRTNAQIEKGGGVCDPPRPEG